MEFSLSKITFFFFTHQIIAVTGMDMNYDNGSFWCWDDGVWLSSSLLSVRSSSFLKSSTNESKPKKRTESVSLPWVWSTHDLPWMGLQTAVCPAFRAECGSSSRSLNNVSMVSFASSNFASCCPLPFTLTMYFFCNKACPVLQAAALSGTRMATELPDLYVTTLLN